MHLVERGRSLNCRPPCQMSQPWQRRCVLDSKQHSLPGDTVLVFGWNREHLHEAQTLQRDIYSQRTVRVPLNKANEHASQGWECLNGDECLPTAGIGLWINTSWLPRPHRGSTSQRSVRCNPTSRVDRPEDNPCNGTVCHLSHHKSSNNLHLRPSKPSQDLLDLNLCFLSSDSGAHPQISPVTYFSTVSDQRSKS